MIEVPFSPNYGKNLDAHGMRDGMPCIVCGRACPNPRYMVHLYYGGTLVTEVEAARLNAEEMLDPKRGYGDLSFYPIGADCLRKHPELRAYAHASENPAEKMPNLILWEVVQRRKTILHDVCEAVKAINGPLDGNTTVEGARALLDDACAEVGKRRMAGTWTIPDAAVDGGEVVARRTGGAWTL